LLSIQDRVAPVGKYFIHISENYSIDTDDYLGRASLCSCREMTLIMANATGFDVAFSQVADEVLWRILAYDSLGVKGCEALNEPHW
jgi:hypothetical protein